MRHFHRCSLQPDAVLATADAFFPALGLAPTETASRARGYAGALGTMRLDVRAEGGHYTFVEVSTDQIGESRLDKNVKKFFVRLHKRADPAHALDAAF